MCSLEIESKNAEVSYMHVELTLGYTLNNGSAMLQDSKQGNANTTMHSRLAPYVISFEIKMKQPKNGNATLY